MKPAIISFLITVFMLLTASVSYADGGEATSGTVTLSSRLGVEGYVKDSITNLGLPGALVKITAQDGQQHEATTNSDGHYLFDFMPEGLFSITVTADNYMDNEKFVDPGSFCNLQRDFKMKPKCVAVSGSLNLCAQSIVQHPLNVFTLSGNVNINGILFFNGQVIVDKREQNHFPVIRASCGYYARNIKEKNILIYSGGSQYEFYANGASLIADRNSFNDRILAQTLCGFEMASLDLVVDPEGKYVRTNVFMKFPYPFDEILKTSMEGKSMNELIEKLSFDVIYDQSQGIIYAGKVEDLSCDFKAFNISELSIEFDQSDHTFGGSLKLEIPGGDHDKKEGNKGTSLPESIKQLPVSIQEKDGTVLSETTLGQLLSKQTFFGKKFLEIGFDLKLKDGALDKLIISVGTSIPLGSTGLILTEVSGGIDQLTSAEGMTIEASCSIETALPEIPGLGTPIAIEGLGIKIRPFNYLRGEGTFKIFNFDVSSAYLEYDAQKNSLTGESTLNIADILIGNSSVNLQKASFSGSGILTFKTPTQWPGEGWGSFIKEVIPLPLNTVISSREAFIDNNSIKTKISFLDESFAVQLNYGKPDFPYFHLLAGKDYDNLYNIWKGTKSSLTARQYLVPAGTPKLFASAGDTLNHNPADFVLVTPLGDTLDSSYPGYHQLNGQGKSLMFVNNPQPGEWTFISTDSSDVKIDMLIKNQEPSVLLTLPAVKATTSNQISLSLTDTDDTLWVKLYYDTDSLNYDGSLIQEFQVVNNANLDYTWQNDHFPEGKYYIYCIIDDGKNAPVAQYAPGYILIGNGSGIPVPQDILISRTGDTLRYAWGNPDDSSIQTIIVYCKDISNNIIYQYVTTEENYYNITDLIKGHEYRLWCNFVNDEGDEGPASTINNVVFNDLVNNNPPYFIKDANPPRPFITGQNGSFTLSAKDADNDALVYMAPGNISGILVSDSVVTWTPDSLQQGAFNQLFTVSDGVLTDSITIELIVYGQEFSGIKTNFSANVLHFNDNMFAQVRNFQCVSPEILVILNNLRTGESNTLPCRKVNRTDYIGRFILSHAGVTSLAVIQGDSILLSYEYNNNTYFSYAIYDTLPQVSDLLAPSPVNDLQVTGLEKNKVMLKWTAKGDNGNSGQAYRYDLRYAFHPIATEQDYLVANRILQSPLPSASGIMDSLVLQPDTLFDAVNHDTVWFAIKAEDAMQNRSSLSNSPEWKLLLAPGELHATVSDSFNIILNWQASSSPGFRYYRLYKKINNWNYEILADSFSVNSYTDDLYLVNDASYQYALQVFYNGGQSDTISAGPIVIDRYAYIYILCQLQDTSYCENISVSMTGIDNPYGQHYELLTDPWGLVVIDNIFKGKFTVTIAKEGYYQVTDTIDISREDNQAVYTLDPMPSAWAEQSTGFTTSPVGIKYISAVDTNVLWALGINGTGNTSTVQEFTNTSDGGENWVAGSFTDYPGWGTSMINALDNNTAWVPVYNPGGGGKLLKTADGGISWQEKNSSAFAAPSGFPNVVHFWNAQEGFCMGDPVDSIFEIYTTTDGGESWIAVPSSNIPPPLNGEYGITGYYSVVEDNVWFGTNLGRVYISSDKGLNWTVSQTPASGIVEPEFITESHGIVRDVYGFFLSETFDGGQSWEVINHTGPLCNNGFAWIPGTSNTCISVGNNNGLYGASVSFDGGQSWKTIEAAQGSNLLCTSWIDLYHGWAGTYNTVSSPPGGGIYRFNNILPEGIPDCVIKTSLSDTVTTLNPVLTWEGNGEIMGKYMVFFDTVNPPLILVQNRSVSYYECQNLLPAKLYYWKIVPYNYFGINDNCPVWEFLTPSLQLPVTGRVVYDNTAKTPLSNIQVSLKQGNTVLKSILTDEEGYFAFDNIPPGIYKVNASCSYPWGGVNAIDGLSILRHFTEISLLQGLRLKAADVNASSSVNSIDGLMCIRRFASLISSFAAGDWVFETPEITLSGSPVFNIELKALCTGDVNGSNSLPECPALTANAGEDQNHQNSNHVELNANIPGPGETGTWTVLSGTGGNFQNIHDQSTVFTGITPQTYILQWTITNYCGKTAFDRVRIDFTYSDSLFLVSGSCPAIGWWDPMSVLPFTKNAPGRFTLYAPLTVSGYGFKFLVEHSWNNNWGAASGQPGVLAQVPNDNATVQEDGFYKVDVDFTTMSYSCVKTGWGILGSAVPPYNWSEDINLNYAVSSGLFTWQIDSLEVQDGEFKFRANDNWSINFGDDGFDGYLEHFGANIPINAGIYDIKLILEPNYWTYTIENSFIDPCQGVSTFEYGGKTYNTVAIGTQCWMKENLDIGVMVSDHNTGVPHSHCSNNDTIEKYCYDQDPSKCDEYGGLYDWNEMMNYNSSPGSQGICPQGWHIPADAEWCTLFTYLDPSVNCSSWTLTGLDAGGKLKEEGTVHWGEPNMGATNASGFTALGTGCRGAEGFSTEMFIKTYFWSSDENSPEWAPDWYLENQHSMVGDNADLKTCGLSVRCIKD